MKTCPNCKKEVPDHDWYCPFCHTRMPSSNMKATGHASSGDLEKYNAQFVLSVEDKNMIRDKNHQSSDGDDDIDCAQPYNFITRENGDRN